jgi:AraC-like DNA-binding protein
VLQAVHQIAAGESITSVALDLGYASPAAFTSMFKRVLGMPPSRYVSRSAGKAEDGR